MRKRIRLLFAIIVGVTVLAGVNWVYQIYNNPVILFGMFSSGNYKSSNSTWKSYEHLFERHSTPIMTKEYLAALAQAESAGNPIITPEWKFRFTTDFFKIYAPASTSAGLYQYTKPTFKDAKRFCIHNHKVALKGSILDLKSCWFNNFYSRLWPSHAIEMTSARLHYYVEKLLDNAGITNASLSDKHKLASIIHLCGTGRGKRFVASGFHFSSVPKCGSHSTKVYYNRINRIMRSYR